MLFADISASTGMAPSVSLDAPDAPLSIQQPASSSLSRPVITYALVSICVAIFLAMCLTRVSPLHFSNEQLIRWGANFGPLTLGGQWWRLFTSVFLHVGLLHLVVNMWCLWDLGSFAERIYGRGIFLMGFLVTGLASAMVSLARHPFSPEAGASGAIFGIAGMLIASAYFGRLPFPRRASMAALVSVVVFAAYNLMIGFFTPGAGNAAHVGGLVSGLGLGLLLARLRTRTIGIVLASLLLVSGYIVLARAESYIVPADKGRVALNKGNTEDAIRWLNQSIQQNPKFADGYAMLGQTYMQKQQFPAAEAAYRQSLALKPHAKEVTYQLGLALIAEGDASEASEIFRKLAASDPNYAPAQMGIGTAAELAGNYQLALESFKRAAKIDPKNPQACANLGLAALQLQQNDEAVAAFSQCVKLQPRSPKALANLALAYKVKGMEKEAKETFEQAQQLAGAKQ